MTVRPWWACTGDPCTCPTPPARPAPVLDGWRTPLFVQPPPMPELDDDQETDQ